MSLGSRRLHSPNRPQRPVRLGPIEVNRPYLQQLAHAIYRAEINAMRAAAEQLLRH